MQIALYAPREINIATMLIDGYSASAAPAPVVVEAPAPVANTRRWRGTWTPPVVDPVKGHRGTWSRTISEWRLRLRILDHIGHGGQTAIAKLLDTDETSIHRALHPEFDDEREALVGRCSHFFERIALFYGYRRQPGNREFYVALALDDDGSSVVLPAIPPKRRAA